jgi:predicted TPR repeat methyltransferase
MVCACLPVLDLEEGGDPIEAAEALIASGRAAEAAQALRARLDAGRGGAQARITLVTALLAAKDVPAALAEAREAAALSPDQAQVITMLGAALLAAEQLPTAIAELQRALRLDPDAAQARHLLAQSWLAAGEADKALETGTEDAALIARAEAIKTAQRSDPGYVRHLFDQFSADYDQRMRQHLHYAAPEILLGLAVMVMPGREQLRVLDLGCGTGLAGEVFKPLAAQLDGVDLSPAMIEKARARGLYDHLAVADLQSALLETGPSYDLILAADTLVYLGGLAPVFAAASARLAPDGFFLFTTEAAQHGFELGQKRRWRHSESYLRQTAEAAGLVVAGLLEAAPRRENNQPVAGFAVALTTR